MKRDTKMGSRIAEVHNGSSLFTGDAGQGESNIRRWIIENDYLEAIVALPLNMFYNTGIATYIWVLTNRKPAHRQGKVQLIDATEWYSSLRKNLGAKNCELSNDDIRRICDAFLAFEETEQSKIFPNKAFGYYKVTVERPLRLAVDLSPEHRLRFRDVCCEAKEEPLADVVDGVAETMGNGPHLDFNGFMDAVAAEASEQGVKLIAKRKKLLQTSLAFRDEAAEPVIKRVPQIGQDGARPDSRFGRGDCERSSALSLNTNPIASCAILNRCHCSTRVVLRVSCAARCCPMPPMPGMFRQALKLAMRSALPATSTSHNPCGHEKKSALI